MKIVGRVIKELPTIYFLLALVGFELVASLLMPPPSPDAYLGQESYEDLTAITQVYTIPYRVFSLLVMIGVILFYKEKKKYIFLITLFTFYYILWLIRLTYDLFFRSDIPIVLGPRQIIFTLLGFLSIFVIKRAYWHMELDKVFKILVFLMAVCVFGMLIRNPIFVLASSEIISRTNGSVGLNTISTANMAMSMVMMIIFWFVDKSHHLNIKLIFLLGIAFIVAIVIGLRASSRGPIISFAITLSFYVYCLSKYKQTGVALMIIGAIIFLLFNEQILEMIGYISPVLRERFMDRGESGFQREEMARQAIWGFLNYPIFGYAHGVMFQGAIGYPHNTVLEAFNGLGIIGGVIYLMLIFHGVKASYFLIHIRDKNAWVCLLFIIRLAESMFSGNFYNDEPLCMLWVFVFLYYYDTKNIVRQLKYASNRESDVV